MEIIDWEITSRLQEEGPEPREEPEARQWAHAYPSGPYVAAHAWQRQDRDAELSMAVCVLEGLR